MSLVQSAKSASSAKSAFPFLVQSSTDLRTFSTQCATYRLFCSSVGKYHFLHAFSNCFHRAHYFFSSSAPQRIA